MQPTLNDLQSAFNRTHLANNGISFAAALESAMLKNCLVRMANIALNKTPQSPKSAALPLNQAPAKPPRKFWWVEAE